MSEKSGVLGLAFVATRIVQLLCLIPIIGMVANFISRFVLIGFTEGYVWNLLLTALAVACIATLYCLISLLLLFDGSLAAIAAAAGDFLFLIPIIVILALMGQSSGISRMTCNLSVGDANNAAAFANSLMPGVQGLGGTSLSSLATSATSACRELKAVWALFICLSILFFFSAVTSAFLWNRKRKAGGKSLA